MRLAAIIGPTGKGPFNTPVKIENIKELHSNFGRNSDLVFTAEQLLFGGHIPIVVRIHETSNTAQAYLTDQEDQICMLVSADSPGYEGNATSVEIINNKNVFSIKVYNNGEQVELWGNLKTSNVKDIVNIFSQWIKIEPVSHNLPESGIVQLSSEEESNISSDDFFNAVKSLDDFDFEFISVTDCEDTNEINKIIRYIAEGRQNSTLVINPPLGYDVLDTYKWCKSLIPSEYAVLFWPWVICDKRIMPPAGPIMNYLLNSPFPWKLTNEKLAGFTDLQFSICKDELAYLSKKDNFINLIKSKNGAYVDKKIRTLSGDALAERSVISYVKSKVSKIGLELLKFYDPYDKIFKDEFIKSCDYILNQVKEDCGIINYEIKVYELSKPDGMVALIGIMNCKEFLQIEFKFTR